MRLTSRKPQHGTRVELSMTPMIDVVFLLLIFFMTTASFVRTERHLDPSVRADRSTGGGGQDLEPIVVEVVEEEGAFVYKVGGRAIATYDELVELLRKLPVSPDGAFVRAADDSPFGMAAAAIQACRDAQLPLVTYLPR